MCELSVVPLVDALDFREGPGIMAVDFQDTGVPLIRLAGLKSGADLLAGCNYLDPAKVESKWQHFRVQEGDVLLSTSASLGEVAVVTAAGVGAVPYTGIIRFRPKDHNVAQEFIQYALRSPAFKQQIVEMGVGSVMNHFGPSHLKRMTLSLPSVEQQRGIAKVLGALDDKIAANATLVSLAEHLMTTQALSATETVKANEIASQSTASVRPESFDAGVAHFSLPAFDAGVRPETALGSSIKSNKFAITRPSVLMSKLNPRIPRIWNIPKVPHGMALSSTEFVVLQPHGVDTSALWAVLSQPEISVNLTGKVAGTSGSHQRVKPVEILSLVVRDPRSLPDRMRDSITSLGLIAHSRREESAHLAAVRDVLLPQLMSGKIRVRDAERVVEGVV